MKTKIELEYGQLSKVANLVETRIQELRVQKGYYVKQSYGVSVIEPFDEAIKGWQKIRDAIKKELG